MRSRKAASMQRIRKSDARYNVTILNLVLQTPDGKICHYHRNGKLHWEIMKEELERTRGIFP